jgi:hypothetical protein
MLIYCDADIFFFRELPNELLIDKDVLLSEHIFHTELLGHLRYGLYNAGFVGFRNNRMGQAKLKWWRIKCFEKCSKIPDEQTFADQKYLEQVADRSTRTGVIREFVVNQSIWAWDESTTVEVGPTVNSLPLVCFHFHGVRLLRSGIYTDLHRYGNTFNKEAVFTLIYSPYKSALKSNLNYHGELPREIGKSLLRRKYGFMPW